MAAAATALSTRRELIGLAEVSCTYCHGLGVRLTRHGADATCHCVYRSIFRVCFNEFRRFGTEADRISIVTLDWAPGLDSRRFYSRKREEFRADFCLVARRVLNRDQIRVFRLHFVLGADWKLCCRQLRMERGNFFHDVYRIEQTLGQVFAELQPYALYPVLDYFSPPTRAMRAAA